MMKDDKEPERGSFLDDGRPFSPSERKDIRDSLDKLEQFLEEKRRMKWAWSSARIWAGWIAGTIAAFVAAKDYIIGAFKGAFGGP